MGKNTYQKATQQNAAPQEQQLDSQEQLQEQDQSTQAPEGGEQTPSSELDAEHQTGETAPSEDTSLENELPKDPVDESLELPELTQESEATQQPEPTQAPTPEPTPAATPALELTPPANSVLTAAVSESKADGGLPIRAIAFRDALNDYMVAMSPSVRIDPVEGGRRQARFYTLVLSAIKDSDPITFMASMEVLIATIRENSGNGQVFNIRYATRFSSQFSGGQDQRKAWEFLWVVLHAAASPEPKRQLAEIDWSIAFQSLADEYRVRLQQWLRERY